MSILVAGFALLAISASALERQPHHHPSPIKHAGASWYDDAGNTACGFHAAYGVANRTLQCGTKVTFYYGHNSVTATVDDRGPFIDESYRLWDLNQNVAGVLGFSGVQTVGYRIR